MEKIILASSSPRRKELLNLIGLSFEIHPSHADETISNELSPSEIVEQLALRKARDVADKYHEGYILGADTIVVLDEQVLGKPENVDDAFAMLKKLQGREHQVFSGIALIDKKTAKETVSHQVTKVFMKKLTDQEIEAYISTKEPMDKAGSYGIQGYGAMIIDRIDGDYFNVVGLPLSLLEQMFKLFNVNLIKDLLHSNSSV